MKTTFSNRRLNRAALIALSLSLTGAALAQSGYQFVDLTPVGFGSAACVDGNVAYGLSATTNFGGYQAAKWVDGVFENLHPAFLNSATTTGTSTIDDVSGNVQVGYGTGVGTNNRTAPMMWHGTVGSAQLMTLPFTIYSGTATSTDGVQAVGTLFPLEFHHGIAGGGAAVPVIWDVASGVPTELDNDSHGAYVSGVGGGEQVGYTFGSNGAIATTWHGTPQSRLEIHPLFCVSSVLADTDGTHQVGYGVIETRRLGERHRNQGGRVRYSHAMVWSGTAESAIDLHVTRFAHTYANSVAGNYVVGYGWEPSTTTSPSSTAALVWKLDGGRYNLKAYTPSNFANSTASGVDANGTVAGTAYDTNGVRHAVLWIPIP